MKVIPQLVLIVIPSFIHIHATSSSISTRASGCSDQTGDDGRLLDNETLGPGASRNRRSAGSYEPDLVMDAIEASDYPLEVHVVVTKDGYILKLHRIPDPALQEDNDDVQLDSGANGAAGFRGVVLLMHGMFSTAADFVVTGPDNGLAFVLADAGYDVWLGNTRGTRYSRKHISVSPKMAPFWDFSWHEIGTTDLAAMIDYILRHSGERQLHYVGHNQGVTAVLVLLAEKPSYNRKIITISGMAPLVFLGNGKNELIERLAKFNDQIWFTLKALNIFELTPSEEILKFIGSTVCSGEAPTGDLCSELLGRFFGFSTEQAKTLLPELLNKILTGISTKQLIHYGQLMDSGKFHQFDYKIFIQNMQHYKLGKPPEYNLSRITVPFTLFYGSKDFFTSRQDMKKLLRALPKISSYTEIPGWTHMDFIYNVQVYAKVYSKIIESMKNFTAVRNR
ncbi:lipase 3-like [Wyeomyia smithii]|uniref:lipase 3-like n=1 Tax=Wyeomyia smithii TaxID=174621 RepID=UPI0024682248|nr:lipase 3-like [Wyeomyia smithii]